VNYRLTFIFEFDFPILFHRPEVLSFLLIVQTLPGPKYSIPFAPRIDPDAEFPVLPDHPLMMLLHSHFQPKPWIFGYTKDEALAFYWGEISPPIVIRSLFKGTPKLLI
jgi:hypothetical protein